MLIFFFTCLFRTITGPENSDSFYIEGAPNSGPNANENFADDSDFGPPYPQHSSYRGPSRGAIGMRGGGMRPPYNNGSNGPMGRPPFMNRCPPPGQGYGPRPPGQGQRFGPPRGMGPRGPPPMMQGGYDYQRPMRPHFPDSNGPGNVDQMDSGWDMVSWFYTLYKLFGFKLVSIAKCFK